MPAPPPRTRRPVILLLVDGVFLVLVGITATAQAAMVSAHFSAAMLNDVVGSDAATVRSFVNANLTAADLEAPAAAGPGVAIATLETQLGKLIAPGQILRVEVRLPDGRIVAASEPGAAGRAAVADGAFSTAAGGSAQAAIVPAGESGTVGDWAGAERLIREYLPVTSDGHVRSVVGIWRDAAPIVQRLSDVRRDVVVVTLSAGLIAAALLYLVFRSAQGRLTRQTSALVEATRRDPLTDMLNHGALVGHLAESIETARSSGLPLGIALVDIDNFRLLNDNHGHEAGDAALLAMARLLRDSLPDGIVVGRYGPDEFLLVAPPDLVFELEPALERLRTGLADLSLQFEASERLPVTFSAGICTYPEHGSSSTVLMAVAASTLGEARAGGGDAILVAGTDPAGQSGSSGFDVLQGLVLAIDTKDRYTKRHSEDVARYATFLAERVGADADLLRSIRVAGLLHDVGKIGIPDQILRKPGKLTDVEYGIVKQHVALGDMIVRDLPDIEIIRAGIRHHHERWDGDGYLHRLEGEDIPLIARILAVGDAFSAMTTTRPYRKALGIREALTRLEDAAGTQLEERLVRLFVDGIETAPDAPLPGTDVGAARLWTPRVA
jgi:diguanylate cyclase (GGDEF)-like protein